MKTIVSIFVLTFSYSSYAMNVGEIISLQIPEFGYSSPEVWKTRSHEYRLTTYSDSALITTDLKGKVLSRIHVPKNFPIESSTWNTGSGRDQQVFHPFIQSGYYILAGMSTLKIFSLESGVENEVRYSKYRTYSAIAKESSIFQLGNDDVIRIAYIEYGPQTRTVIAIYKIKDGTKLGEVSLRGAYYVSRPVDYVYETESLVAIQFRMADSNDWYQGVFDVLKSKTISFKMKLWTCLSPQGLYYRNDRAYFWQLVGFRFVEIDAKTFEEVRAIPYLDSEFPVDGPICPSAYNLNGYETILFTGSKSRLIDMKTGKTLQEFPPFRTVVNTGDKVFGVSQLSGQSCDSPDNETTVFNIFENTHVRIKRNFPWGLTSISVVNDEIFTVIDGDRCKKGHFNIIRYN